MKRPAAFPIGTAAKRPAISPFSSAKRHADVVEESVKTRPPLDFFCYYVRQVCMKHGHKPQSKSFGCDQDVHPYVCDHGFPPPNIEIEANVQFVQQYLLHKVAKGDKAMQVIVMGAFQAPDQPFCFKEVLPDFLAGVRAHRKESYRRLLRSKTQKVAVLPEFQRVQSRLEARYIRGIDPAKIASGARKGNVYGYGEVGIYNAEHQTSVMPGLTHPEGLRWKLEHWPLWLERVVLPQLQEWPSADDRPGIEAMLQQRYPRKFPQGLDTPLPVGPGKCRPISAMFGGDLDHAASALSQALLFADIIKPEDGTQRRLRRFGLGAGTFTVRGFWMAYNRDRTFPALETRTFCPGFTGALKGAESVQLEKATGVKLTWAEKGSINWTSWQTQLRFAAWLHALQQHVETARLKDRRFHEALQNCGVNPPLHCTEIEASLCFMSRLVTMFEQPRDSQLWQAASRGIGTNLPASLMQRLFD